MAVRSKQLQDRKQVTPANADVVGFTPPTGETTILKAFAFTNVDAAVAATVWLGRGGLGAAGTGNFFRIELPPASTVYTQCWVVFGPGIPCNIRSTLGSVRFHAWGAELEGVAD